MNRNELINAVAEKTSLSKKDSSAAVSALFQAIENTLSSGEKVTIPGFGTFETRKRNERQARNPRTNETITIPAVTVPAFRPGKVLKNEVAGL